MAREPGSPEQARELRLEGITLALAGGVLLALLFGAFQLGRRVERWNAPARAAAAPEDPLGAIEQDAAEPAEKLTFFDTLSGQGKEAEPKREAASTTPTTVPTPPPPSAGPWYVQVFVGRDRAAAEEVVRTLRAKGYPVRTDAVSEGSSGSLYKVRVGGFGTKDAADAGADRLHKDGQNSTWVVRVGS